MWARKFLSANWDLATLVLSCLFASGCTSNNIQKIGMNVLDGKPAMITPAAPSVPSTPSRVIGKRSKPVIPTLCKVNVLVPAKFSDATKRLMVFETSPTFNNIPAKISWRNVRYQIAPARFPVETVPAQYHEVTERIEVLRRRIEVIGKPARYKSISKPVTVQRAHIRWKEGCVSTSNPGQCFERVPTKYKLLKQEIVDMPAITMQVARPEQVIEFKRKILVTPGQGSGKPIPARYKTIRIGKVTEPWRLQSDIQPSRHEAVPIKIKQRTESIREMPVLCTEQATETQIMSIQRRLRQQGYNASIKGHIDQQTMAAVIRFQQDNDLAIGAITLQTLRKLGL